LVLSGREVFPDRADWERLAQQDDSLGRKIKAVQELELQGAQVLVSAVDLTDQAALSHEVQEFKRVLGPIGGVIHAAGLADAENPAFIRKTPQTIARVMAPKVQGLNNLIDCLVDEPLAFMALFSSVSAIVPSLGVGQSDYAMANAYMDYVAQARANQPLISIQWGSWKESGMGEVTSPRYRSTGFQSHTDAEGLVLLDQLLASPAAAVVMPVIVDRSSWQPHKLLTRSMDAEVKPQAAVKSQTTSGTVVSSDTHADVMAHVQVWLHAAVAEQLKLDISRLDLETPLQDYGVDSVMLMQLQRVIEQRVKVDKLDPTVLFENSTVAALSVWLARNHGAAFAAEEVAPIEGEPLASQEPAIRIPPLQVPLRVETERPPGPARRSAAAGSTAGGDIAVIGMSCRFAGSDDLDGYWRLLSEGRSAIQQISPQRWGRPSDYVAATFDKPVDFDGQYFLISSADAKAMDPQALLVLEQSRGLWAHAGYTNQEIKGQSIGVYLGGHSQHRPAESDLAGTSNPILAVGQNYLASNISRFYDLRGPSLVVDTACSSALVALNLAVQSLNSAEISAALVGGVSLLESDDALKLFNQRGILSGEPQFHLFDRRASGTILGEGAGMVLIKRLEQALEDGDQIYAVLKGLAVNNDGRTIGTAAPNPQAQRDVMQAALAKSGKSPHEIDYIEVNGTGTLTTDLLELKVIQSIYRADNAAPCQLGSMKPNIGHPLGAEGIASLIKVVLMLHHRQWVPFLSAQQPMEHYDFAASPFRFSRTAAAWKGAPRVAAVNCFADGGTNVHLIVQGWDPQPARQVRRQPIVVAGGAVSSAQPAVSEVVTHVVLQGWGPRLSKTARQHPIVPKDGSVPLTWTAAAKLSGKLSQREETPFPEG
jgi:3-oxoacyl-(acyl-carrier-protein) synthase/acyl carrier protein